VVSQDWRLIIAAIPSGLRILISCYCIVDDMLVVGSNIKEIVNLKVRLAEEFSMKSCEENSWNENQQRKKRDC